MLVSPPEHNHAAGVFGSWSPVDRSTPEREVWEDRLDAIHSYHLNQVDQRHWYGFWDYGDVMHSYDADRHVWRYDVRSEERRVGKEGRATGWSAADKQCGEGGGNGAVE